MTSPPFDKRFIQAQINEDFTAAACRDVQNAIARLDGVRFAAVAPSGDEDPHSLIINVKDSSRADDVKEKIEAIAGISKAGFAQQNSMAWFDPPGPA